MVVEIILVSVLDSHFVICTEESEDCQEEVYQRAHQCLKMFIESFPLYVFISVLSLDHFAEYSL